MGQQPLSAASAMASGMGNPKATGEGRREKGKGDRENII